VEEQVMGRNGKQDLRVLIRRAQAEIDALYPGLIDLTHPHHYAIVDALAQADSIGGRIPIDTPYLGETLEAHVIRDATVTLPPRDPEKAAAAD